MNEAYAEFVENYTNYQQQRATIETMKASGNLEDSEVEEAKNQAMIVEGFQLQTNQARAKQEEFTSFMERIREDIDVCAEQFGHVEYYEASLRDAHARATAQAAASVRELDPRRMRLAAVSPYLAQNGAVPPEPRVSEELDEDISIDLSRQVEQEIDSLFGTDAAFEHSASQEVSE
jgi:predicted CopG family antitoxin